MRSKQQQQHHDHDLPTTTASASASATKKILRQSITTVAGCFLSTIPLPIDSTTAAFTTTTTTIPAAAFAHPSRSVSGTRSRRTTDSTSTTTSWSSSSSSSRLFSTSTKMDQSFPTWTFDKACSSMEWNELVKAEVSIMKETIDGVDVVKDGADLIILGVMAPPKGGASSEEGEEDEEEEADDKAEDEKADEPVVLSGLVQSFDESLDGALSQVMSENGKTFKNGIKIGSMTPTIRVAGNGKYRAIVMGMGKTPPPTTKESLDLTTAGYDIGKAIATKCNIEKKVSKCRVVLPYIIGTNSTVIQDIVTTFYETLYSDNRYRTGSKIKKIVPDLIGVDICIEKPSAASDESSSSDIDYDSLLNAIDYGKKLALGTIMAKDIVNAPHNVLNSESLAETAKRIAMQSNGVLECKILDKKECEKRGMGAYLAVARASETQPQFIHMTYKPPTKGKGNNNTPAVKKIAIVGKGLLFDTGGYNIKTSMMEMMKFDCGGAAATLGTARAVAALKPENIEVHFIVAACENMIDARGVVGSDILTASNGKTIEVMNTDAEGRLTLADALVYADVELGCSKIVELSTLTGACMVALGKDIAGIWTSSDELAKEIELISKETREKTWRMPLATEYNDQLESKFADMKNVGTRYGGSITAALFLQNFVRNTKKTPFAHIDVAGPVWNDKMGGATGYGVKLLTEWIRKQGLA